MHDVVARAIERAGVESPSRGTHILRQSLATRLLREGATLSDLLVQAGTKLDVIEVHSERLSLHDIYVQALGNGHAAKGAD